MALSNLCCAGGHLRLSRFYQSANAARWRKVTETHQGILGPACSQSKYQEATRVPQAQRPLHSLERGSPFQHGSQHSELTEGALRKWEGVLNRQQGLHQSSLRSSAFGEARESADHFLLCQLQCRYTHSFGGWCAGLSLPLSFKGPVNCRSCFCNYKSMFYSHNIVSHQQQLPAL
jgi:hypothetical protein